MNLRPTIILGVLAALGCGCGDDGDAGTSSGSTGSTDASTSSTTAGTSTSSSTTGSSSTGDATTSGSETTDPSTGGTLAGSSSDSGGSTSGSESGSTAETTGDLLGECVFHANCASGYCQTFQDSPPDPDSICADPPAGGNTRFTGTLYDFETMAPIADASVAVTAAVDALTNPTVAAPIFQMPTDDNGRFDMTSSRPLTAALGVLSLAQAEGYALTGTGLAQSPYAPGNIIHDVFMVPQSSVDSWSAALAEDQEFASFLPLGTNGGVVGIVRDGLSGDPVAGATVSPAAAADEVIRYLDADGMGFNSEETSDLGIFVIGGIATVAQFNFAIDGEAMPGVATGGSAPGAIFVMNFISIQ